MNPPKQPTGEYQETGTGIVFPLELGGLKRSDVHPYASDDKAGVAIAYGSKTVQATIFVTRRKDQPTPDGSSSEAVRLEMQNTLAAIDELEKCGTYRDVKKYGGDEQVLGTSRQNTAWARAAFSARTEQSVLCSFIYVTGSRGHTIKVRLTVQNPENSGMELFLSSLGDLISRKS